MKDCQSLSSRDEILSVCLLACLSRRPALFHSSHTHHHRCRCLRRPIRRSRSCCPRRSVSRCCPHPVRRCPLHLHCLLHMSPLLLSPARTSWRSFRSTNTHVDAGHREALGVLLPLSEVTTRESPWQLEGLFMYIYIGSKAIPAPHTKERYLCCQLTQQTPQNWTIHVQSLPGFWSNRVFLGDAGRHKGSVRPSVRPNDGRVSKATR